MGRTTPSAVTISMVVGTSAFASPSTGTSTRIVSAGGTATVSVVWARDGVCGFICGLSVASALVSLTIVTGIVVFSPVTRSTEEPFSR